MPLGMKAPKLWPALPLKCSLMVSSGRPSGPKRRVSSLPVIVPTTRFVLLIGRVAHRLSRRAERRLAEFQQQLLVERLFQAVVLPICRERPTSAGTFGW